jgi:hypothetical protein
MGCVVHSKVGVAESMGHQLLYINFKNDSTYVMLANVYSAAGRKDEEVDCNEGLWSQEGRWSELD